MENPLPAGLGGENTWKSKTSSYIAPSRIIAYQRWSSLYFLLQQCAMTQFQVEGRQVDNGDLLNCQKFVFVPFSVDSIKREL
jgi:hypothetical protein